MRLGDGERLSNRTKDAEPVGGRAQRRLTCGWRKLPLHLQGWANSQHVLQPGSLQMTVALTSDRSPGTQAEQSGPRSENDSRSVVSDSLWPHGLRILQARILEWATCPFSRGSLQPRDRTQVSLIAGGIFTNRVTREAKNTGVGSLSLLQGIFLTQESNWGLLHCRQILYQLSYQGSLAHLGYAQICYSETGRTANNSLFLGPLNWREFVSQQLVNHFICTKGALPLVYRIL